MAKECEQQILDDSWFVENLATKTVIQDQIGVFRSNCLDSLDRTNVAQSKLGMLALQFQLEQFGVNLDKTYGDQMNKDGIAFIFD